MRIDGSRQTAAAYAPERRQKEAGGSAERRLRFAVASNVPFDVEDVESEMREGASSALPQCADPQRFSRGLYLCGKEVPCFGAEGVSTARRAICRPPRLADVRAPPEKRNGIGRIPRCP